MAHLETEITFFRESVKDWISAHAGKVALVKDDRLVGVFDNESTALSEGARLFGDQPFLVRRIQEDEQPFSVPAYTLGILSANFACPVQWTREDA
jgi:hypothetical protein